ncbi:MAG: cysteine--tRNA ligase, partial [Saprospiraceae bacterium]|nr:cysteine--tRNA ligase [Saprospiraceae bacterium]
SPQELFSGDSSFVSKGYSPMVVKFFMLMAHYRSTLDITDDALLAAEKGFRKLMDTNKLLQGMSIDPRDFDGSESDTDRAILQLIDEAYQGMDDDFNTAMALASLNELGSYVNKLANKQIAAGEVAPWVLERLKTVFHTFISDILGLKDETSGDGDDTVDGLMELILDIRGMARAQKDWTTSDKIRDALAEVGIQVKDGKEGVSWSKQ